MFIKEDLWLIILTEREADESNPLLIGSFKLPKYFDDYIFMAVELGGVIYGDAKSTYFISMRKLTVSFCLAITALYGGNAMGTELPACIHTIYEAETKTWDRCIGAWKYKSPNSEGTAEYNGEWRKGKRTGYGILILKLSKYRMDKYEGEFKEGKRTGHGTYSFANGDKYVGSFINGEKTGKGEYTFSNGDKYIGEFQGDKMHGEGKYIHATGKVYSGLFKEGNLLIKKDTTPINKKRE